MTLCLKLCIKGTAFVLNMSAERRGEVGLIVVELVLPFLNGSRIWALKLGSA